MSIKYKSNGKIIIEATCDICNKNIISTKKFKKIEFIKTNTFGSCTKNHYEICNNCIDKFLVDKSLFFKDCTSVSITTHHIGEIIIDSDNNK